MANQIKFNIGFNVDKSGLAGLKSELSSITKAAEAQLKLGGTDTTRAELQSIISQTKELEQIFGKSYNFKLNTLDFTKLSTQLKEGQFDLQKYTASLSKLGIEGPKSFRAITSALVQSKNELQQSSTLLEKMGKTFANTIRWSIASSAINSVTSSVQKAWSFTKELDSSLNDIMIVTGKNADEMANFARQANKAAQGLGSSTKAYTQASLIYYQQGLSDEDVAARSAVTTKAANVTGQSAQAVSEQLTAVWNGYKVSAQEAELYVDKLAAVAASTAADLEELSTGMSRVASAANIMGVDVDQLNAQLATIVSVTREAPESIGTALKTVYARMSDLEAGTDTETTLGEYTKQMSKFGIQALDSNGKLRDMGDVVEEIGNKWHTLSRNQQVALAQTVAGTRQYARMMSLFDNWDMYNEALKTSQTSMGTLQKQQDTYMESTEAHLNQLKATSEELYMELLDPEAINPLIDGLTTVVELFNNFVQSIGGGQSAFLLLGAIITKSLVKPLGEGVGRALSNRDIRRRNEAEAKAQQARFNEIAGQGKFEDSATILSQKGVRDAANNAELLKIEEQLTEAVGEEAEKLKARHAEINAQLKARTELAEKLADPIYAQRYDQEVAAAEEYHKKEIWFMQNRYKMSAEEQKQWREQLSAQKTALDNMHSLNEQDYVNRQKLEEQKAQIEKDYLAEIDKINAAEAEKEQKAADRIVEIEKEKQEKLKKIREQAEADLRKSAAQKEFNAAEKEGNKLAEQEARAREVFLRQARTVEGEVFSDKTAFTYREGAQSGGAYISPDKAISRLEQRDSELALHDRSISGLERSILKMPLEGEETVAATEEVGAALQAEIDLLQQEADQLNISIERLNEYQRLKREYDEAVTQGDIKGAQSAGHKITTMAAEDVSRNQDENRSAREYLSTAVEKQAASSSRRAAAKEGLDKERAASAEAVAQQEIEAAEEAEAEIADINKGRKKDAEDTAKAIANAQRKKSEAEAKYAAQAEQYAEQVTDAENEQKNAVEEATNVMNDAQTKQAYEDFGQGLGNIASGTTSVITGFMALKNIGNIFSNDDLSTGEKFMQILMAMGTGLPMVITGVKGLSSGLKTVVPQLFTMGAGGAVAAGGEVAMGEGAKIATPSIATMAASIWSTLWPVLLFAAAAAALIGVIYGLVKAFEAMNEVNAANKKAEEAAAHANEMADAYNRTRQEYENLKASIADYKDAQAAIDNMIAGTDEWRDAIADANAQVTDLITTYPELAKYMSSEGGRLTISEEGLAAVEEQKRQEANQMQRAALLAKQSSIQADLELSQAQANRSIVGMGADEGALIGGLLFGGVGAAVGAAIAGSNDIISQDDMAPLAEALAKSPDAFSSQSAFIEALRGTGFEDIAVELWENREALQGLTEATTAAEAESATLRQQLALTYLQENKTYKNWMDAYAETEKELNEIDRNDYGSSKEYLEARLVKQEELDAIQSDMNIAEQLYSSEGVQAKIRNQYTSQVNDAWDSGDASAREEMVKEYWSQKLGIPTSDIEVKNTGGGNYKVRWRDQESGKMGDWEKNSVDSLKSGLAEIRAAAHQISDKELNDALERFRTLEDYQEKAFESFIGDGKGDFSKLTHEELKKLKDSLSFDGMNFEDVKADESKYAELKSYAEKLGLETTDEALSNLLKGINDGLANYDLQEQKIQDNFLSYDYASNSVIGSMNQAQRSQISQLYYDLAAQNFSFGAEGYTNPFDEMLNTLTESNKDLFLGALNSVDWTNQESVEEYKELLTETNGAFKLSENAANDFIFQMKELNNAFEEFDINKEAEKVKSLQNILKNINEFGDTLSGEEYETLSSDMQKYFLHMRDGTYALIGSAEEFKQTAKEAQDAQLLNRIRDTEKRIGNTQEEAEKGITEVEKDTIIKGYTGSERYKDLTSFDSTLDMNSSAYFTKGYGGNEADDQLAGWKDEKANGGSTGDVSIEPSKWLAVLDQLQKIGYTDSTTLAAWRQEINNAASKYKNRIDATILTSIEQEYNRVKDEVQKAISSTKEAEAQAISDATAAGQKKGADELATLSEEQVEQYRQYLAQAASVSELNAHVKDLDANFVYDENAEYKQNSIGGLYRQYLTYLRNASDSFTIDVDPYEELDRSLNQVEKRLNKIEETQDLLYGQAAIDNLKAYNQELANQIDLINQKIELNQEEAQKAKENLEALAYTTDAKGNKIALNGLDYSYVNDKNEIVTAKIETLTYDDEGNITNWEEYVKSVEDYIKRFYDADSAKSTVEALNTGRDDYIAELEKGAELIEQKRQTFLTALEKNLEAFELEIQIKIDENEFKQSILDFKTEMSRVIGDTAAFDLIKDDIATYMQALDDLDKMTKVESLDGLKEADIVAGNLISKADYETKKREIINSLMEEGISLREAAIAMDEQANEKYEKYINLIDSANSALDHQKDLYELIYGDQAFAKMNSYYSQQVANAESVVAARLAQYQQDQEFMANAGTELSEYAQKQYLESAENYFQALNDLAALYQEKYINELKTALDNFDKEISGGLGTQALRDEWDWVAAVAEDSLSKIDAAIGINSLESSFTKAIDAAPSISAQKTLNKLRDEELTKLRAKEKLTQADLDRAQKSLEITQAEIALQEAQMNKSKMRLTRGPDGTYSYQYVADQDAIAEKTDELNKLKQELVDIDENAAKDAADKVYEIYSEMIAKIEELGPDATEEEIYAVMQQYSTRINSLSGIAADALGKLRLSAQSVADAFGIEGSLEEIVPWTNTGWIDTVTSFASNGFENMFSNTWDTIKASLEDYRTKMYGEEGEEGLYSQLEAATTAYLESLNGDEGLIKAQEAELTAVTKLTTAMGDLSNYIESIIQVVDDPNYVVSDPASYDTGGYTGEWDPSGRLAILHQKELVLNAADTQKILDVVSLVRSFENSINSALSNRYMEQLALMSARLDLNNLDAQETNIEQTVHITAEFPNVSVKEEIEAAFEDIIDLAAQYAMENKK